MPPNRMLIIGISGVTCGGKTTLACKLKEYFPKCKMLSQDDYFLDVNDPRHVWMPELDHINFDILSSLDMEKMYHDIQDLTNGKQLIKISNSKKFPKIREGENLKSAVFDKLKKSNLEILIVEGFCVFNYKPLRDIFHLKYYFTLSKDECFQRRTERVYDPPDCPGYFEKCAWPEHVKQLEEVQKEMRGVKYFDGISNNSFEEVLLDVEQILDSVKT